MLFFAPHRLLFNRNYIFATCPNIGKLPNPIVWPYNLMNPSKVLNFALKWYNLLKCIQVNVKMLRFNM